MFIKNSQTQVKSKIPIPISPGSISNESENGLASSNESVASVETARILQQIPEKSMIPVRKSLSNSSVSYDGNEVIRRSVSINEFDADQNNGVVNDELKNDDILSSSKGKFEICDQSFIHICIMVEASYVKKINKQLIHNAYSRH